MAAALPVIDPADLTEAMRYGRACVGCDKRWPRPRVHVGNLPDGTPVFACGGCEVVVEPSSPAAGRTVVAR
jgi:hypothetical protein